MSQEPEGYYVVYIPAKEENNPNEESDCSNVKWSPMWVTKTSFHVGYTVLRMDPIEWAITNGHVLLNVIPIEDEKRYCHLYQLLDKQKQPA